MPPKTRITREMILEAAYAIAREHGADSINARNISQRLDCSTQPVLYHFDHVEDIRHEVYRMADSYHTSYLMQLQEGVDPLISIGLNYIRFAAQEKPLFRLLFQSDYFANQSITDLINMPDLMPILETFRNGAQISLEQTKNIFRVLLMLVHGYASILANNTMEYNENEIISMLRMAFTGMIDTIKSGEIIG